MFENLGPGKMQLFVDPPPRGIFTYEDTVSGKVVFELTKTYPLGFVYVYFHGWVNTQTVQNTGNFQNNQGPSVIKANDKEVLFQYELKVFQGGREKIPKGTHFEWPFKFNFRHPDVADPSALPTSGVYSTSNVEYKVVVSAAPGTMDETLFKRMRNPDDQLFQKEAPINLDKFRSTMERHLGAGAEQELQFLQIRPNAYVGNQMAGPFNINLDISGQHLPQISYDPASQERHGLLHRSTGIPFAVILNLPKNIVEGAPFPMYMSVTSWNQDWTNNPPPVQLTSLKIRLIVRTISRASMQHSEDDRRELIFEGKNLGIQLGPQPLDIGQLLSLTIQQGNGIVPSFNSRLLQRAYDLPTDCTIEVAGKTFKADFPVQKSIELVSNVVATGIPATEAPRFPHAQEKQKERALPEAFDTSSVPTPAAMPGAVLQPKKIRLKHTYIGHLTQEGNGPVRPDSVIEAALALIRVFTAFSIQLEFTGGTTFKILPYSPPRGSRLNDKNYDQRQSDHEVMKAFMAEHFTLVSGADFFDIFSEYNDPLHDEKFIIQIPQMISLQLSDHFMHQWLRDNRDRTDEVNIDPVVLFNYRLSCALTRPLQAVEVQDFQSLYTAFERHLRHHKKHIELNTARVAAERYGVIGKVLQDLGLELEVVQKQAPVQVDSGVRTGLPGPSSGGFGDERNSGIDNAEEKLVKGFKNLLHRHHK